MQTGTTRTFDGLKLHTLDSPVENAKGVVYIVHGINEHIGRYAHVVDFLNRRGYAVYGHDHRGHGRSEGERAMFDSFDQPVADLKARVDDVRSRHPGVPVFIYGHSMGSLISTLFVAQHPDGLAGWVSTGSPLWFDKKFPGFVQTLLRAAARVVPNFKAIPIDADSVSRDEAVVKAYKADPLNVIERTRLAMAVHGAEALERARQSVASITLPVLIVHGEADRITPLAGSRYLYDHIGSADKTLRTIPAAYHEVHNEPEQQDVLNEIAAWLDAHG
ncbi:MAG: alpha/beta hydrolase [Chloroflexi bacterium]|nr:alpha/beta hydrolase [Chloroflexota bacterium]